MNTAVSGWLWEHLRGGIKGCGCGVGKVGGRGEVGESRASCCPHPFLPPSQTPCGLAPHPLPRGLGLHVCYRKLGVDRGRERMNDGEEGGRSGSRKEVMSGVLRRRNPVFVCSPGVDPASTGYNLQSYWGHGPIWRHFLCRQEVQAKQGQSTQKEGMYGSCLPLHQICHQAWEGTCLYDSTDQLAGRKRVECKREERRGDVGKGSEVRAEGVSVPWRQG